MKGKKTWANAVLKDGKLMFWWTGRECNDIWEFNKDFYYAGLDISKEIATGRYELAKRIVKDFYDTSFYEQFELHEDFKGRKPY